MNEKNVHLGQVRSSIRELFEYGKIRKAEIGEDNVFDFSLGNPSVPAPQKVKDELCDIIENYDPVLLHGYTSAQGDAKVRAKIAEHIQGFGANVNADDIYMTCGAAASLTISLNAILNDGDEAIVICPYFPEYKVFIEGAKGVCVPVKSQDGTFQLDLNEIEKAITPKTRCVIVNSPNNPSGVVYDESSYKPFCDILRKYSKLYGDIFLIADEPYRELVYDKKVPHWMNYYDKTIVCYSYSKSLSLPGERIGYIAVNGNYTENRKLYSAICGAGRSLGYVCAPNLFQQLVARLQDVTADVSIYKSNRDILCSALSSYGYQVVRPDGAFYLFVKSLEEDSKAFCERAKKFELLLVAGDDFGAKGYVRISYCVSPKMIEKSLSAFCELAKSYK